MTTTPDKNNIQETWLRDGVGQGYTHQMHNVTKYYSWKIIVVWLISCAALYTAYSVTNDSGRAALFGVMVGMAMTMIFRPFNKRWKYTILSSEYKPFIGEHKNVPYTAQYMDEPTTIHNKRTDGQ